MAGVLPAQAYFPAPCRQKKTLKVVMSASWVNTTNALRQGKKKLVGSMTSMDAASGSGRLGGLLLKELHKLTTKSVPLVEAVLMARSQF